MFVKLSQGKVSLDVEKEVRFYEIAWDVLGAAGFAQYEISNYARPGHACRHNLDTWAMQEWVGLGPSGASQFAGWRYSNPADLRAWQDDLAAGRRGTADRVALTPELLAADALIFGLRCNAGVEFARLAERFPSAPWERYRALAEKLVAEGLAEWRESARLALTARGRLLADAVGGQVLEAGET